MARSSTQRRTRGREGRRQRQSEHAPYRLGELQNPFPPIKVIDDGAIERITEAAFRLLEEAGLEFRSDRVLDIMKRNGADVDHETSMVRIGRDVVRSFVQQAPSTFTLHARNPAANVTIGGRHVNFMPVGGPPNVSDLDRGRRPGDFESVSNLMRLNQALGVTQLAGASLGEPMDLPVDTRHLDIYLAQATLTDRVWNGRGIGRERIDDALDMIAIARATTREALVEEPSTMTVINVNSPRRVDEELLDGLMAMVENGQPCLVTPFTLAGAMSPVTIAGALAQQTAEALGVIALVQMIRPGCPVVFGGFTSNVDMKTGAPTFGTPEYVKATLAGGQIARHFGLPYRSSNVNASNAPDAQAVYESAMSLWAAIMGGANVVHHATGWLEGGLTASFEKTVIDAEMIRGWAEVLKPLETRDEDLALEAIAAVPPGGHFFGEAHTLARFENAFYEPILSDWRNFEAWQEAGALTATERANGLWKQLLEDFVPPEIDPSVREALEDFVARRKCDIERR